MTTIAALSRVMRTQRRFSTGPKQAEETAEMARKAADQAKAAISEKAAAAQQLAQETMRELFGSKPSPKADDAGAQDDKQQQQQQQGAGPEGEGAPGGQQERQSASSAPRRGVVDRFRGAASAALAEMRLALSSESPATSALRGAPKGGEIKMADTTALAHHKVEEAAWQKQWRELRDKVGSHPLFERLSSQLDEHVVSRGRDVAGSLRERWETSDSPLVHRIQDAADSWSRESESAGALREIRARDPAFDVVDFLLQVKADIPVIIKAYLEGQEDVIKEHCSPEMTERLLGIMAATAAAGQIPDATLLDTSDPELVDLKLTEDGTPCVIVQFTCQQINCARDAHGNVVDGAPDDVHRVYYYWALAQEASGYVGTDGRVHPPRWQLREMLIRGMHHLI